MLLDIKKEWKKRMEKRVFEVFDHVQKHLLLRRRCIRHRRHGKTSLMSEAEFGPDLIKLEINTSLIRPSGEGSERTR